MHPSITNKVFTYKEHSDLKAFIGLVTEENFYSPFFGLATNEETIINMWKERGEKVIVIRSLASVMNIALKDWDMIDLITHLNSRKGIDK